MTRMFTLFLVSSVLVLGTIVAFYFRMRRIVAKSARDQMNLDRLNEIVQTLAMQVIMSRLVDEAVAQIMERDLERDWVRDRERMIHIIRWIPDPPDPTPDRRRQRKKVDWNKVGF